MKKYSVILTIPFNIFAEDKTTAKAEALKSVELLKNTGKPNIISCEDLKWKMGPEDKAKEYEDSLQKTQETPQD